jgi:hypothetical protein
MGTTPNRRALAGIAWVDTRPSWDDTGVTVGALLLAAGFATGAGLRWWAAALLVAAPIFVAELPECRVGHFGIAGFHGSGVARWRDIAARGRQRERQLDCGVLLRSRCGHYAPGHWPCAFRVPSCPFCDMRAAHGGRGLPRPSAV